MGHFHANIKQWAPSAAPDSLRLAAHRLSPRLPVNLQVVGKVEELGENVPRFQKGLISSRWVTLAHISHIRIFRKAIWTHFLAYFRINARMGITHTRLEIDFLGAQKVVWGRSISSTWHHSLPTCFAWLGRVCSMCPGGEKRGKVRWVRPPLFATGLTCTLSRRGKRKILFGDYMRGGGGRRNYAILIA